jgi:hypothetical protein
MAGGILQLVTSGKQDVALTYNPEITFFKKVYRRYTNFSLEFKEVYTNQLAIYGDKISFSLSNADLVHRCFIQVEIPTSVFYDTNITNNNYILWKTNLLQRLQNTINKWKMMYNNLKNFISIELLLYQKLLTLFLSDNITLNNIKEIIIVFNNTYKSQKTKYSNLIETKIFNKINMSGYLLSLDILLTNDNLITIKSTLESQYKFMNEYLTYYHSNWKQNLQSYNKITSNQIYFAWTQYLGHYYFSNFELEIGGQIIDQYTSDQFHIYQLHHLSEEQITNYYSMIAHLPEMYTYDNNVKTNKILFIPLIFWFCKTAGSALPLIGMRNTDVNINLTINKLKNLIYFRNWEEEYNNLIKITLPLSTNVPLLDYKDKTFNLDSKQVTYNCININAIALGIIYDNLKPEDITFILDTFGIVYKTYKVMTVVEWIIFRNNLYKYPILVDKIGGYDSYIDYNYLMNLIPKPNIKLLVEYIYIDDIERSKFASSKLEYVIEGYQENVFDITNLPLYNADLSIDRPNKYLKWFIQPKNFINGITEYGPVTPYIFDYSKYYKNSIYTSLKITLNQIDLLNIQIKESFYNLVTPYKCLNRSFDKGINFYNFSLYPEEVQPSGTANLTIIKEKKFSYQMNRAFLDEYFNSELNQNNLGLQLKVLSISYNFFIVHMGSGRLIFSIS